MSMLKTLLAAVAIVGLIDAALTSSRLAEAPTALSVAEQAQHPLTHSLVLRSK
jgi:hypothetical protein